MALTSAQRTLATAAWDYAAHMSSADVRSRLWESAGARYSNALVRPFLVLVNVRQVEFVLTMIASYRAGRFNPQQALVRTLLEVSAEVCWAALPEDAEGQEARIIRILLQGYREGKAKGDALPAGAEELLRTVQGKDARKLPSFEDQLVALDDAERKQEGGIPHWQSHAEHYDWASKHLHPSIRVALSTVGESSELGGFKALAYGFQYFALGSDALLRLAGLEDDRVELAKQYAAVKPTGDAELARLRANEESAASAGDAP